MVKRMFVFVCLFLFFDWQFVVVIVVAVCRDWLGSSVSPISKHVKGPKERYLLGQNTTCKLSGGNEATRRH